MNQPGLRFATRHMRDEEAAAAPAMSSGAWGGENSKKVAGSCGGKRDYRFEHS